MSIEKSCLQKSADLWKKRADDYQPGDEDDYDAGECPCCQGASVEMGVPLLEDGKVDWQGVWQEVCGSADDICNYCPIQRYTGLVSCSGTPYYHVTEGRMPARTMADWLQELADGGRPEIWEEP